MLASLYAAEGGHVPTQAESLADPVSLDIPALKPRAGDDDRPLCL